MAAIISGAIHNLKEGWEDQQRLEAEESRARMSEAKLGNLEADFLAAALALKEKKKDTVLPPIFRHVDPDLVVPGTNKRKEAGPAWIEEDQYEYESSDDDEVVVGNDRHHVMYTVTRFGHTEVERVSKEKALGWFSLDNPVRKICIKYLITNPWFDYFITATILINCVFLGLNNPPNSAEYVFTAIFTMEMVGRVIGLGFIRNEHTYLRDNWNKLDFIVVLMGYIALIPKAGNYSAIKAFRVFRILRAITAIPELRVMIAALGKCIAAMTDIIILIISAVFIFAIFALQLYAGTLRQKCIADPPHFGSNVSDELYHNFTSNESNWIENFDHCGNASYARHCPANSTCLVMGDNPNFGFTNFDNFGMACLVVFQLITADFWEDVYDKVLMANGYSHIIFFVLIIFLGAFYLMNLVLAVVAVRYELTKSEDDKSRGNIPVDYVRDVGTHMDHRSSYKPAPPKTGTGTMERHWGDRLPSVVGLGGGDVSGQSGHTKHSAIQILQPGTNRWRRSASAVVSASSIPQSSQSPKALLPERYAKFGAAPQLGQKEPVQTMSDLVKAATAKEKAERLQRDMEGRNLFKVQRFFLSITETAWFVYTITFLIVANTVVMAVEGPFLSAESRALVEAFNYFFTSCFTVEMVMKIFGYGFKGYFSERQIPEGIGNEVHRSVASWNRFDCMVVTFSLVEIIVEESVGSGIGGLSILRSFRLLRVLKLGQTWGAMNRLIKMIGNTVNGIAYLSLLLFIILYTFAVLGMQLFGVAYEQNVDAFEDGVMPRWHYVDFGHAFMSIFRILCGEWVELLWDTMLVSKTTYAPVIFYVIVLVVGNFVMINLFLSVMLEQFGDIGGKTADKKSKRKKMNKIAPAGIDDDDKRMSREKARAAKMADSQTWVCCCASVEKRLAPFRKTVWRFLEDNRFEAFILIMIAWSSIMLVFEDKNLQDKPKLQAVLDNLNIAFCAVFTFEMVMKILGYGWRGYFQEGWNCLDCFIVITSIVSLITEATGTSGASSPLYVLRTLRALRPLRAVRRWEGMKLVVNALIESIPGIGNVMMICLIFWLIFSILGVQLFGGKFARCLHRDSLDVVNFTIVNNKSQCCEWDSVINMTFCDAANNQSSGMYLWEDTHINFNHVGMASIALFQVATFEGWMEVMASAADAVGVDQQPQYEHQFAVYFFFATFIIIGAFFVLNLFIGVIIDQFNSQKKKSEETGEGGGLLLTESQKRYVRAMTVLMLRPKPTKEIIPPTNRVRLFLFKLCTKPAFETWVIIAILLNSIVFSTKHYGQTESFTRAMLIINATFTILFLFEAIIKLVAFGRHYFKDNWNKFDFLIVVLSTTGLILETQSIASLEENLPIAPVLARVFRVARVLRLAKSLKFASNIKKLLIVMMHSAPALLNIGTLIFLVMFIFSVVGMSLFKFVQHNGVINDYSNMETFPRALQLLFRLCTSAGWNDVTDAYSLQEPHCDVSLPFAHGTRGDCGSPTASKLYFTGYILLSYVIMVNMYIAVILDNMVELIVQSVTEQGIPAHAFDDFYRSWVKYDRTATQFVAHQYLCEMLSSVPRPLGFSNESCTERDLGDLAIPLYVDGDAVLNPPKAHVGDVLDALVQRYHQVDTFDSEYGGKELRELMHEKLASKFPVRKKFGDIQGDTHAYYLMTKCTVTIQRTWRNRKNVSRPLENQVLREHSIRTEESTSEGSSSLVHHNSTTTILGSTSEGSSVASAVPTSIATQ